MCFDSWAVILSNCDFVLNVELYTNELKNQIEYERWVAGARASKRTLTIHASIASFICRLV